MHTQYDTFSPFYDDYKKEDDYKLFAELLQSIRRPYDNADNRSAWDIGTGTGLFAEQLIYEGYQVTGTDSSCEMIRLAKRKGLKADFLIESVLQPHRPKSSYSLATAVDDIVNCLSCASEVNTMFENVYNALTPLGLFQFDLVSKHGFETYMIPDKRWKTNKYEYHTTGRCFTNSKGVPAYELNCSVTPLDARRGMPTFQALTEQYYEPSTITQQLKNNGFDILSTIGLKEGRQTRTVDTRSLCNGDDIKILYLCRKEDS